MAPGAGVVPDGTPGVDIGLIGLGRLDPVGGAALLVVIPAMWLGFGYGVRGAVITGVSTVAW